MWSGGATAEQFNTWEEHAKTCCEDSLQYIIKDATRAKEAMQGWNPEKENYYADCAFTYIDELQRRLKAKNINTRRK
jgi:hypothetical protein